MDINIPLPFVIVQLVVSPTFYAVFDLFPPSFRRNPKPLIHSNKQYQFGLLRRHSSTAFAGGGSLRKAFIQI